MKLTEETKIKHGLSQLREKNHQWKGGYIKRRVLGCEQLEFKKNVYKRDNYTCQICGKNGRGTKINAHHLNSVNKYPLQANDINNGITLCEECHKKFHKKYGYGNNTIKQFNEFITEKVEKVEKIKLDKSIIYNLTLKGQDTFYANGILTHNTPPGTYVSIEELRDWCRLKLGDENAAYAVAKKILNEGIDPKPFIRPVIDNELKQIVRKYVTE